MRTAIAILLICTIASIVLAADKPLAPYKILVLQSFTIDPELAKANFPPNYQNVLQKTLFARLWSEHVFENVGEASLGPGMTKEQALASVIASGEVVEYDKGNRAARVIINYGAGAARLKIVMIFRDARTGKQVLRLEQAGSYAGFGNITGGSAEKARFESARKVVDGLVKKIREAK